MKLSNFIDGLNILRPYYNDGNDYNIGCEHDKFYAYKTDIPLPPPIFKKMYDLGWFQPERGNSLKYDPGYDSEYDSNDGWSVFT